MNYIRPFLPMIAVGAVITGVTMTYQGQLFKSVNPSSLVQKAVDKILGVVKLSSASGVGKYINILVQFAVTGFLVGLSLIVAQRARGMLGLF